MKQHQADFAKQRITNANKQRQKRTSMVYNRKLRWMAELWNYNKLQNLYLEAKQLTFSQCSIPNQLPELYYCIVLVQHLVDTCHHGRSYLNWKIENIPQPLLHKILYIGSKQKTQSWGFTFIDFLLLCFSIHTDWSKFIIGFGLVGASML